MNQYPQPVTICLTYFRSLTLANLEAALYSVSQQDLQFVDRLIVVDNNTEDPLEDIEKAIDGCNLELPVKLISCKHGDPQRTHSWSANRAIAEVETPWVLFTRADYLLDFSLVHHFVSFARQRPDTWNGFITSNVYHLHVPIAECEKTNWRSNVAELLQLSGVQEDYAAIDSGVWMARKRTVLQAGGFDERLSAWGHAQTLFQHNVAAIGTEFIVIPSPLFYHPAHGGEKDITRAHAELVAAGYNIKTLWARHTGAQPY